MDTPRPSSPPAPSASHNVDASSPVLWFGASYYPHHYEESEWERDLEVMVRANVNALRVGDFAWTRLEPRCGDYQLGWLERWLNLAYTRGIRVLLIPPIRCAPAWLMEMHPDIAIVNDQGVTLEFGSRYTFCINHPEFRARGLALAKVMGERLGGHPAIMGWHLDNEYGDEPDCHCHHCKTAWHHWLTAQYGDAASINEAWGTVFWNLEWDHIGQIPTPRATKTYYNPGHWLAWREFRSECTRDIMAAHAAAVRAGVAKSAAGSGSLAHQGHLPITSNLQCLHNFRTDYFRLADVLDTPGINYYPPYGENFATNSLGLAVVRGVGAASGRASFQLHELRNGPHAVPGRANNTPLPGEIERLTLHCVAHGADAIFYFQWRGVPFGPEQTHGTPTGYDGRPNRSYHEVARVGERLKKLTPILAGSTVHSDVAVFYDFRTRWGLQGGEEWCGPNWLYLDHAKRIYEALRRLGLNCDVCGRETDWSGYSVIVVPILDCLDAATVDRLTQFVENGGTLVWHPLSGTRDREGVVHSRRLDPALEKLLGLTVRDFATGGPDEELWFLWHGRRYSGRLFCDLPQLHGANSQGTFLMESLEEYPAVTEHRFGKGHTYSLATFASEGFYHDFFQELCNHTGLVPLLGYNPPAGVEVVGRKAPGGGTIVFVLNRTREEQYATHSRTWRDVESGETFKGAIRLGPSEVRILQVVPRS